MKRFWPIDSATLCVALLCMAGQAPAAEDPTLGDIRDIRVGLHADRLPADGYVRRRCVAADGTVGPALDAWTQFARCPVRNDGLHEVVFEFDESKAEWAAVNDKWEGTKVSGHPVVLSLLFSPHPIFNVTDRRFSGVGFTGLRGLSQPLARLPGASCPTYRRAWSDIAGGRQDGKHHF